MLNSRRPTLRAGILLLILSLLLTVLGIFEHIWHRKIEKACTAETIGTVTNVRMEESKNYRTGTTKRLYKAIVTYEIPGSDKQYTLTTQQRKESFIEGQQVTVMYDPDDVYNAYSPDAFRDSGQYVLLGSLFFGAMGLIFTIVAIRDKKYGYNF